MQILRAASFGKPMPANRQSVAAC